MIAGGVTHALRVRRVRFAPVADVVTRRSEPAVVTVETDRRVVRNVARAACVTVRIAGTVFIENEGFNAFLSQLFSLLGSTAGSFDPPTVSHQSAREEPRAVAEAETK